MITIRKSKDSDALSLVRLHRSTIRKVNSKDYLPKQIEAWAKRSTAKRFKSFKKRMKRVSFVAVALKKIIGFGDYENNEVMGLYVHHNFIGKGVGTMILDSMEKNAYKSGVRFFYCTSTVTARKFYEKNGFKVIRKTIHQIKDQKLPVFRMKKCLLN